jgi:hypothetical protein
MVTTASPPAAVLGADAAPKMLRWAKALSGLDISAVPIERDTARVQLKGGGCELVLSHRDATSCEAPPVALGETAGCWTGEGCPSARVQRRALAAAGPLELPWRIPAGDHMATGGAGADAARVALIAARKKAAERLDVMDRDGARAALLPLLESEDLGPWDLLGVLPVLGYAGAGREAVDLNKRPDWVTLPVGLRALTHVALTLGPDAASAVSTAALSSADACGAVSIASGFVVTGRHVAAARLAGAIRDIDPRCVKAYAVELEAWSELDRGAEVIAVWEAAKVGLGGTTALAPLEGIVLDAQGKTKEFVERLEAAVAAGDHSPGTMKRILAFYVREDFYEAKAAEWTARVKAHPEDEVASFFAGVLAHYAKDFKGSNELLKRSAKRFANEPRLYIYLAMNYFNLGDQTATATAIGRAEALEVQDPDVFYCQGEIFRDTDRPRALRALRVYWHQTRWNTDANSSKQRRVWGLIEALERCIAEATQGACEGPWEHTFASGKP